VALAERQIGALERQRAELEATIAELRALRDTASRQIAALGD